MADEKNQGSQQAPRKKKSKREREKETKKERKKRKKERKKGTKWRQQGRQVRKQTRDKEHPVRRKHPDRTTAMKREVSKQVGNKQRDGRGNRWDTRRVLYPKQPNEEH